MNSKEQQSIRVPGFASLFFLLFWWERNSQTETCVRASFGPSNRMTLGRLMRCPAIIKTGGMREARGI